MANIRSSTRSSDVRRLATSMAFRQGFDDARMCKPFAPVYDMRSVTWQWLYESGRLFAASPLSRRFKRIPDKFSKVTPTLCNALVFAWRRGDITKNGVRHAE